MFIMSHKKKIGSVPTKYLVYPGSPAISIYLYDCCISSQYFTLRASKHIEELTELCSEYPYTHHPESTIVGILLYLLYCISSTTDPPCVLVHFKPSCRHQYSAPQNTSALHHLVLNICLWLLWF